MYLQAGVETWSLRVDNVIYSQNILYMKWEQYNKELIYSKHSVDLENKSCCKHEHICIAAIPAHSFYRPMRTLTQLLYTQPTCNIANILPYESLYEAHQYADAGQIVQWLSMGRAAHTG